MKNNHKLVFYLLGCLPLCKAQPAVERLEFESATVKLHDTKDMSRDSSIDMEGSFVTLSNVSLGDCLKYAYAIDDYAIGGAKLIGPERYDVIARVDSNRSSQVQVRGMVQTLLADRLGLKVHHEIRQIPGYSLAVDKKGLRLTTSADGDQTHVDGRAGHLGVHNMSMEAFASQLTRALRRELGRPIANKTGLTGKYTFTLDWTPTSLRTSDATDAGNESATSIFSAISEQLGLRLVSDKIAADIIVIDSFNKVPTDN